MIQHNQSFTHLGHKYHYDANAIQAYRDNISISLREFNSVLSVHSVLEAFQALMGVNGDKYAQEIFDTNALSQASYDAICDNIKFNGKDSIIAHFGLVYYYYLQRIK